MRIIHGLNNIRRLKNPIVALGVFDGVHRGHIRVLRAAVNASRKIGGTSVALTFDPHPQEEESLCSLEHRLRLISAQGIDACIIVNFNRAFAKISAGDFVKDILCSRIRARELYVGRNYRFGKSAQGNVAFLNKESSVCGFKVRSFDVIRSRGKPVSSTLIRALIKKGDLHNAQRLLSRPVSVLGTVTRGIKLGRRLGFPTANINPHHEVVPASGVYAVKVIIDGRIFPGTCYIGTRPTLKIQQTARSIEVYIFGLNKNIYGEYAEIQFIKKIRESRKFKNLEALSCQIKKDIIEAKKILSLP